MIDTQLIREWLWLKRETESMEYDLKEIKEKTKEVAAKIHTMLAAEGSARVNVDGVTVFPKRVMRASTKAGEMDRLIEGFRQLGDEAMITTSVNAQRLSSYVNQFDPDRIMSEDELRAALPEEIRDSVNLFEDLTVGYVSS